MTDRPQVSEKDISITLAAGEVRRIYRAGRDFQCISVGTDGVVQLGLSQSGDMGRFLYKGVGGTLLPQDDDFDYLEFLNTSGSSVAVVLQTSRGPIRDSRFNLVGTSLPFVPLGPATIDTPADVSIPATSTATIIRAATGTQNEILLFNNGPYTIRIGGASVDGTHGIPLASGGFLALQTSGAVYGWNNAAGAVTICSLGTR